MFSSLYPSIIIAFNIGPNCLIGKLIIKDKMIIDRYNEVEIAENEYDAGKDFMEAILSGDILMTATRWFNLPTYSDIVDELEKEFGVKPKKTIMFKLDDLEEAFKNIDIKFA